MKGKVYISRDQDGVWVVELVRADKTWRVGKFSNEADAIEYARKLCEELR